MKTSTVKLCSLFLTIGLFLISSNSNSQDIRLTRQEKKDARRVIQYANFQVLDSMLEGRSFVIKADFLENQYGNRIPVTSVLNFIMVDSSHVVLQTGSNSNIGYNGVGGTTAEGSIGRLKIEKNLKNLTLSLQFTVNTDIGVYDVSVTINSERYARATITGLTRGKLIYVGSVETIYNSGVYKGRNTI